MLKEVILVYTKVEIYTTLKDNILNYIKMYTDTCANMSTSIQQSIYWNHNSKISRYNVRAYYPKVIILQLYIFKHYSFKTSINAILLNKRCEIYIYITFYYQ